MKLAILLSLFSPLICVVPCGTHLPKAQASNRFERFVIGGNNVTTVHKWPWQVLVFAQTWDGNLMFCGGTILSEYWILTAGHCIRDKVNGTGIYDSEKVGAMVSITNFSITNAGLARPKDGIVINVTEAIPFAQYSPPAPQHDIGLLKLAKPLTFDDSISPICLPKSTQSIPSDGYAVAVGFGVANYRGTNKNVSDHQLRDVILPIVRRDICNLRWAEELFPVISKKFPNVSKEAAIQEVVQEWAKLPIVCAGSMGHGVNHGDSGGPLMMKSDDGQFFQVGVAAFISDKHFLDADTVPNAFTDVRPYCEWIKETTGGEASCQKEEVELTDVEIQV